MAKDSEKSGQESPEAPRRVKVDPKAEPYEKLPSAAAKINRLRDACTLLAEQTGIADLLPKGYL